LPSGKPDIGEITVIASNLLSRARRAAPEAAPGRAALIIGAAALAAAGLAACSSSSAPAASSSSPAASPASPAAPAAPASSPAAAASSPAAASGPDVCSLLTSAQVASFTADQVEQVTPGQVGANSACTYVLSNSAIQVQVARPGSAAGYSGFSGQVIAGASPPGSAVSVPGLGQEAIASNLGVAVQGAKYAYLVLNAHGQVPGQTAVDYKMARVLLSALG
jgi:hypothetical protein